MSPWFRNMLQQQTGEVMESEDGSVEFETPTDDEEITIPSQDKYRKVPDIPDSDIGDRQSSTQGCCRKYRCPESESDFPVVARTADFEGRGGIHTAEGGPSGPLSLRVYHVRYKPYLNLFRMVFRRTVYEMAVSVRRTLGLR